MVVYENEHACINYNRHYLNFKRHVLFPRLYDPLNKYRLNKDWTNLNKY